MKYIEKIEAIEEMMELFEKPFLKIKTIVKEGQ